MYICIIQLKQMNYRLPNKIDKPDKCEVERKELESICTIWFPFYKAENISGMGKEGEEVLVWVRASTHLQNFLPCMGWRGRTSWWEFIGAYRCYVSILFKSLLKMEAESLKSDSCLTWLISPLQDWLCRNILSDYSDSTA